MNKLTNLQTALEKYVSSLYDRLVLEYDEITLECSPQQYHQLMSQLKNIPQLGFELLIDLCGIDYSTYKNQGLENKRFAVVNHLLSIENNQRLRIKVFLEDENFPVIDSIIDIYSAADWFEREAFDLYGIAFSGHPDLRRILTDYGFVGHPLRKDFPVSGHVEMRYDEEQKRVIYQAVTIEPREVTPRILREEHYGG